MWFLTEVIQVKISAKRESTRAIATIEETEASELFNLKLSPEQRLSNHYLATIQSFEFLQMVKR